MIHDTHRRSDSLRGRSMPVALLLAALALTSCNSRVAVGTHYSKGTYVTYGIFGPAVAYYILTPGEGISSKSKAQASTTATTQGSMQYRDGSSSRYSGTVDQLQLDGVDYDLTHGRVFVLLRQGQSSQVTQFELDFAATKPSEVGADVDRLLADPKLSALLRGSSAATPEVTPK